MHLEIKTSSATPFYWFTTGIRVSLPKGPCSHSSSNAQITSFRLVLYVTKGASLPYLQYYSIYWFTTGVYASLLKGPRSHSSSNTQITSF
jgi:hypothetical protein